jgi:Siphovirus Gp157
MTEESISIREKIQRLKKIRYEEEAEDVFSISDDVASSEDFKELCLELAEEAIERELDADAIAARIKELTDRKGRMLRSAETLRDLVLQCMDIRGEGSIASPFLTLSVSKIKPGIVVTDESLIPSRFFTPQPPKLDKTALKEAVINDGEVIDGVGLGNGKINLTIRRK